MKILLIILVLDKVLIFVREIPKIIDLNLSWNIVNVSDLCNYNVNLAAYSRPS